MAKRAFTTRLDEKVMQVAQRVAELERRSVTSVIEMAVLSYGRTAGVEADGEEPGVKLRRIEP